MSVPGIDIDKGNREEIEKEKAEEGENKAERALAGSEPPTAGVSPRCASHARASAASIPALKAPLSFPGLAAGAAAPSSYLSAANSSFFFFFSFFNRATGFLGDRHALGRVLRQCDHPQRPRDDPLRRRGTSCGFPAASGSTAARNELPALGSVRTRG